MHRHLLLLLLKHLLLMLFRQLLLFQCQCLLLGQKSCLDFLWLEVICEFFCNIKPRRRVTGEQLATTS